MESGDFSETLDMLLWKFQDNGGEMLATLRVWLTGDDLAKIEAALNFNGGFLFSTRDDMESAFATLTGRYPHFRDRTVEILRAWDARFG